MSITGKESVCQCRRLKRRGFDPWVGKIPWRNKWQPTPVFLPGEFHGEKSLAGYSPWGCKESDTTEHTHTHHVKETLYPGAVTHSSFSPPSAPEPWVHLLSPPTCLFWTFHTNGLHTLCGLLLGLFHLTSFQGCNMGQCFILLLTK